MAQTMAQTMAKNSCQKESTIPILLSIRDMPDSIKQEILNNIEEFDDVQAFIKTISLGQGKDFLKPTRYVTLENFIIELSNIPDVDVRNKKILEFQTNFTHYPILITKYSKKINNLYNSDLYKLCQVFPFGKKDDSILINRVLYYIIRNRVINILNMDNIPNVYDASRTFSIHKMNNLEDSCLPDAFLNIFATYFSFKKQKNEQLQNYIRMLFYHILNLYIVKLDVDIHNDLDNNDPNAPNYANNRISAIHNRVHTKITEYIEKFNTAVKIKDTNNPQIFLNQDFSMTQINISLDFIKTDIKKEIPKLIKTEPPFIKYYENIENQTKLKSILDPVVESEESEGSEGGARRSRSTKNKATTKKTTTSKSKTTKKPQKKNVKPPVKKTKPVDKKPANKK